MCGIFAIFHNKPLTNKDIILGREGSSLLSHRGPDSQGEWINRKSGVFIGHRRLSIIDLSNKANQPMIRKNLVLAYNGEIYNFNELKDKLISKGLSFYSSSDTEVLIQAWKMYGFEVNHLPLRVDLLEQIPTELNLRVVFLVFTM